MGKRAGQVSGAKSALGKVKFLGCLCFIFLWLEVADEAIALDYGQVLTLDDLAVTCCAAQLLAAAKRLEVIGMAEVYELEYAIVLLLLFFMALQRAFVADFGVEIVRHLSGNKVNVENLPIVPLAPEMVQETGLL